jgi:hypothetical protein
MRGRGSVHSKCCGIEEDDKEEENFEEALNHARLSRPVSDSDIRRYDSEMFVQV